MKLLKSTFLTVLLAMFTLAAAAQMQDPVHFKVSQKKVSPTELEVIFTGRIDNGWHVYSTGLPADGPISASLHTEKAEGVKAEGKLSHRGKEISQYDKMFGMTLRYFEHSVTFVQKYKITGKTYNVKGYLEYGACNDENCIPPHRLTSLSRVKGLPMLLRQRKPRRLRLPTPWLPHPLLPATRCRLTLLP